MPKRQRSNNSFNSSQLGVGPSTFAVHILYDSATFDCSTQRQQSRPQKPQRRALAGDWLLTVKRQDLFCTILDQGTSR